MGVPWCRAILIRSARMYRPLAFSVAGGLFLLFMSLDIKCGGRSHAPQDQVRRHSERTVTYEKYSSGDGKFSSWFRWWGEDTEWTKQNRGKKQAVD